MLETVDYVTAILESCWFCKDYNCIIATYLEIVYVSLKRNMSTKEGIT